MWYIVLCLHVNTGSIKYTTDFDGRSFITSVFVNKPRIWHCEAQNRIQKEQKFCMQTKCMFFKYITQFVFSSTRPITHYQKNLRLFGVWTGPEFPIKTTLIKRDDDFWNVKMKESLTFFYYKCLLSEIVDARKCPLIDLRACSY